MSAVEETAALAAGEGSEAPAPVVVADPAPVEPAPAAVEPAVEEPPVRRGSSRRAAAKAAAAAPAATTEPASSEPAAAADPAAELAETRAQLERVTADSAAKDFKHAVERAGVTDADGHDVIEHLYSKVKAPEGGEKPTLAEWLGNRDGLPKAVLAYLPAVAPALGAGAPVVPLPVELPDANGGARPAPSGAQYSAASIAGMIGSPETYAANRDAIMQKLGGKPAVAPTR